MMLEQAWESFAIQGEIVSSLSDILKRLIQVDLHCLAENYGIKEPLKKAIKRLFPDSCIQSKAVLRK